MSRQSGTHVYGPSRTVTRLRSWAVQEPLAKQQFDFLVRPPVDGEYVFKVDLRRNFYNYIRGLGNMPHQLDVRVDRALVKTFMGAHVGKVREGI